VALLLRKVSDCIAPGLARLFKPFRLCFSNKLFVNLLYWFYQNIPFVAHTAYVLLLTPNFSILNVRSAMEDSALFIFNNEANFADFQYTCSFKHVAKT